VTSDDLDPPLARRPLREDERNARESGREIDALLESVVRPRIAAHISACRQALDVIQGELDRLIDTLSIDPTARTRAAALWLLLGRCVGQQRAVLLLAEHGMAVEGRPLDRTVKEMTNLVKPSQPTDRQPRSSHANGLPTARPTSRRKPAVAG
jgi:hypothetical protein